MFVLLAAFLVPILLSRNSKVKVPIIAVFEGDLHIDEDDTL
ncbi:MAG: hypothetical protein ABGX49_03685 [Candidatus Poseidoniia archaeon]|jgi:hypothetical protein